MSEKDKIHKGELYLPMDKDILKEQLSFQDKVYEYNKLKPSDLEKRSKMIKEMFASCGEDCYIEIPFHTNFGGKHVYLGNSVYANYNLTLVDDTYIYIGDATMIGPNVTICTAAHPIYPSYRVKGYQYNKPVTIGKGVWIGAGAIILPGITIGDGAVIGAGSVVTKDVKSNTVVVGNPARALRCISDEDKKYYDKNKIVEI